MSILSSEDIKKELGINLYIYPLELKNLKGNTINLTASEFAWSLDTTMSIVKDGKINIPPNDTALIYTKECVYVSGKLGGTYHSKVKLVSKGLGHIGTTLDPEYIGPSLIAIHNHSSKIYQLEIGETFVSLMFHYLKSPSPERLHNNDPGQPSQLHNFKDTQGAYEWLDNNDWLKVPDSLKKKMIESPEYAKLIQLQRDEKENSLKPFRNKYFKYLAIAIISIIIYGILSSINNYYNYGITNLTIIIASGAILFTAIAYDLNKWFDKKID